MTAINTKYPDRDLRSNGALRIFYGILLINMICTINKIFSFPLKVLKVNCKESPFDNIRFDCLPNVVTEVCPLSCRMMSPTSARDVGSIRIRSITERRSLFLLSYTCTPFGFHCCQLTCHFYMTGDNTGLPCST